MAQGNPQEALKSYRDGLAVRARLAEAEPGDTNARRELSSAYGKLGDILWARGDLPGALQSYRDGFAIVDRLARAEPQNAGLQRDLSVSYEQIGNVLAAQSDTDQALQSYRAWRSILDRLAAGDPGDAAAQHALSVADERIGDMLAAQDGLVDAMQSYRDGLVIRSRLAQADPADVGRQNDLQLAITKLGSLAYSLLLARDFAHALEAIDQTIALAPDKIWLYTNRAHALMFLGRIDEARALYLQFRGERRVQKDKSWETIIREDFADLRKAGLANPLMDEIEARFAANP